MIVAAAVVPGRAHKPITSKYTYNDDVFPILRERCSRCHVPGGVAPMSLMTYEEAFPWAESIRAELVAAHMPPAAADDGFGDVVRAHALSPRELDVIMTWASGGNPRGMLDQKLPEVTLRNDWALGKPDLLLPVPTAFSLDGDTMEGTQEYLIATGLKEARAVRAIDLLPGTPAMVRSAVISLKSAPDQILARWLPGQDPDPLPAGTAFPLPAGAELVVRIMFKKTWSYEGKNLSDRSTVGVYFADRAATGAIASIAIPSTDVPTAKGEMFSFSHTVDRDVRALAVSPNRVPDDLSLQIEAVKPDGSRVPLVRFATRADWLRRYWFAEPKLLPRGTTIEVRGVVDDPDLTSAAFGGPPSKLHAADRATISLALDVVVPREKPAVP